MKENKLNREDDGMKEAVSTDWSSVKKMLSVYTRTTGSNVRLYNSCLRMLADLGEEYGAESKVCWHCPLSASGCEKEPCREMHVGAIEESCHLGGIHIYTCKMGLVFWTSPLFNESCYAGSLRGSGYLRDGTLPDGVSVSEAFMECLTTLRRADSDKIKALAEMLLVCAISLSPGNEQYHDILRRRVDQQQCINSRLTELKAEYGHNKLPRYPIKHERQLIAALSRGDSESAVSSLNDLLAALLFSNQDNFKYIQLRALELAALLSRTTKDTGFGESSISHGSYPFVGQIKNSQTFEELADALHSLVKYIAATIAPFRGIPHGTAMRKAERFIQENFTRKISLSEIASVAGLSAPYFSTVFREEMGENFSTYLNRLRVEKAKHMLRETSFPLSEIASACCFDDQSWFSRLFKFFTGISPGKYRERGSVRIREISEKNVSYEVLSQL